jgi:hypothetical protein
MVSVGILLLQMPCHNAFALFFLNLVGEIPMHVTQRKRKQKFMDYQNPMDKRLTRFAIIQWSVLR